MKNIARNASSNFRVIQFTNSNLVVKYQHFTRAMFLDLLLGFKVSISHPNCGPSFSLLSYHLTESTSYCLNLRQQNSPLLWFKANVL